MFKKHENKWKPNGEQSNILHIEIEHTMHWY